MLVLLNLKTNGKNVVKIFLHPHHKLNILYIFLLTKQNVNSNTFIKQFYYVLDT